MKTCDGALVMAAAVATIAFVAGPEAVAQSKTSRTPAQPVPYDQLNAKAPKARTGAKADVSARVGSATTSATSPDTVNPAPVGPLPAGAASPHRDMPDSTVGAGVDPAADPPR